MARVAFLGSPRPAARCLEALVAAGHEVVLVVTEPDRRRGRGGALSPTAVKDVASRLGIPVTERVADVLETGAELGVVVAFGRLIKPEVLDHLPFVNLHFSLLPRWRGAAPVERALLAGDDRTGVCLMQLDEGLDTGPVFGCVETPIEPDTTAAALLDRLTSLGAALLVERLSGGLGSLGAPSPQQGDPTYAAKITAEDLHIDWSAPSALILRQVRLGRAWTTFRGKRLGILDARLPDPGGSLPAGPEQADGSPPGTLREGWVTTGDGLLELRLVLPEGRQRQAAADWLRGVRPQAGEAFDGSA